MNWHAIPVLLALLASSRGSARTPAWRLRTADGQTLPPGDRRGREGARHTAALAGSDRAGGKRAQGPGVRHLQSLALDDQCRRPGQLLRHQGAGGGRRDLALRMHATKSVDVGCMQISLTYHPDAFSSMDQAFDPASNADYGARFLAQLLRESQFLAAGGRTVSFRDAGPGPGLRAQSLCGLASGAKACPGRPNRIGRQTAALQPASPLPVGSTDQPISCCRRLSGQTRPHVILLTPRTGPAFAIAGPDAGLRIGAAPVRLRRSARHDHAPSSPPAPA